MFCYCHIQGFQTEVDTIGNFFIIVTSQLDKQTNVIFPLITMVKMVQNVSD